MLHQQKWLSHCFEKAFLDLTKKLEQTDLYVKDLRILAPSQILVSPFYFWKKLDLSWKFCLSMTKQFPRPLTKESFWHLICHNRLWCTKKASGNQYVNILRILVPPQILAHLVISVKLGRHCLCSIDLFSKSHT